MTSVRPLVVALAVIAVVSSCDRSPTDVSQPPEPQALLVASPSSPRPVEVAGDTVRVGRPTLPIPARALGKRSNYAVAW